MVEMAVNERNVYILAASWLNCLLYMLEIFLLFQYFQLASRPLLHRVGVGAMFLFDTICTFAVCARVYMVALVFPCQSDVFSRSALSLLSVILFTTYATASIEQLFLCYLYFNLTKQRMIAALLVFSVVVHLAFTYASAILVVAKNTPLGSSILTSKMGAIACAVTDIMIAAALLCTFIRFEKTIVIRVSTQSLLRRLMVLIFTSGVVVASTTSVVMIFLLKGIHAYVLFFYIQGRVYSLTILCNFLIGMPGAGSGAWQGEATDAAVSIVTTVAFHSFNDSDGSEQLRNTAEAEEMDGGTGMHMFASPSVKGMPMEIASPSGKPPVPVEDRE
ncbi:hypothetical protein B0H19DRAFT_1159407 [Mycena capillaripes]|nr:hypothetical protein B0H19DRAFT_1159407 [Mycena capillaripes]